ncbi:MAG TPA: DMT family protein [Cellvibrionaceae bacterium]
MINLSQFPVFLTVALLVCSNIFMTFAWYGHLKHLQGKPWLIAALVSWGIAFFEYLLQVPANRIGAQVLNLGQLKILQEIITLSVFVPFAIFYMRESFRWDFVWAGLCMLAAVFFIFREKLMGG